MQGFHRERAQPFTPEQVIDSSRRTRRFVPMIKRRWPGIMGLCMVVVVTVAALFAPLVAPYGPQEQSISEALSPPGAAHWLGTDQLGRDILSRVIYGGRISLLIGFGSMLLGLVVGCIGGMVAGYYGGWADAVIMRVMDILLAFPGIIVAAGVMAVLGIGVRNLIIALAIRALPVFARLARNVSLSLRDVAYVEAARTLGASNGRILTRHIFPNLISPLIVVADLRVGAAILTGTALSFLGLGVAPGTAEWGVMVSEGLNYMRMPGGWTMAVFPGLAIVLTVVGINLLGDEIQDVVDPKLRT